MIPTSASTATRRRAARQARVNPKIVKMIKNMSIESVLYGDRFVTTQDIKANGLTAWAAPCTGSFNCIIPEGTILVAQYDQVKDQVKEGSGFHCKPEKYNEFERKFVPVSDRYELKYGGYYFILPNENIGSKLKLVSRASARERRRYEFKVRIQSWFRKTIVLSALLLLMGQVVILLLLPFKPFMDMYRKRKLDAKRKADEQNKEP